MIPIYRRSLEGSYSTKRAIHYSQGQDFSFSKLVAIAAFNLAGSVTRKITNMLITIPHSRIQGPPSNLADKALKKG